MIGLAMASWRAFINDRFLPYKFGTWMLTVGQRLLTNRYRRLQSVFIEGAGCGASLLARLTNGFSKQLENHRAAVVLWIGFYSAG